MHKSIKGNALRQLRKAFHISLHAKRNRISDASAFVEEGNYHAITRRKFISDVSKAAMVISVAGIYSACNPTNKKTQPTIAIVGAGIAGLHAAYILKQAGYNAQIYEGSPRTGGRIFSVDGMMGEGLWTEMGGEFIDTPHLDMLNLAKHFNLPLIDRSAPGEKALKEFCYYFDGKHYELRDLLEALHPYAEQIQKDIDSLSDEISFEEHSPDDVQLDQLSIMEYMDRLGIKGWFRNFINSSYTAEYGADISEQSAINFLSIFDPGDEHAYKVYGSSDEIYSIAGGNLKICDALVNEVKENIFTEHLLTSISQKSNNQYQLTFKVGGAGEIGAAADIVILTLPFTTLREVDIKVPLPDWKTNVIRNLSYGTSTKLFVGINDRVWRRQGYTGYAFSDTLMINGYDHTQMQNNNQGKGGYTIFLGGKQALDSGALDNGELQKQYVPALDGVFPGVADSFNNNFQKWNWASYVFAKCSYLSYSPGQYTSMGGAQYKPVDNLYFAGEHCSYDFQGFMNGGAQTGREVAEKIIAKLKV
ncbi:MAG TPA: FAD-dependent oxidoreductase [Chitinophagales bacterium]|nr:FAD-dependent oxidoreductase [Chitinophagales bacterium]